MKTIDLLFFLLVVCTGYANSGTMPEKKSLALNILVFSPHPDDDVIGCGGSIAKHIKSGHNVTAVYMTSGTACPSRYSPEELGIVREKEATDAADILGVQNLIFLRYPDGGLAYSPEVIAMLEGLIKQTKPDKIYIPHKNDSHKDHKMTYQLVCQALASILQKSLEEWKQPIVLCYEVWTPLQYVSHKENITDYMPLKIAALQKHASQIELVRFDKAVKALNRYRGIMKECGRYCECFELLKWSLLKKTHAAKIHLHTPDHNLDTEAVTTESFVVTP